MWGTPKQALADWEDHLKDHLAVSDNYDEVVSYVREVMASGQEEKPVPKHVQGFHDQVRPVKKK